VIVIFVLGDDRPDQESERVVVRVEGDTVGGRLVSGVTGV
jgi:hypothetical protein